VDFTRNPIIETVITPKDGYRLTVRSSKNLGQEEFVVEALEVVSFGVHCFFRNLDRSRAFLVPVSDYEVLEIREGRLPIKAATLEGTVKVPTVRDFSRQPQKESERREFSSPVVKEPSSPQVPEETLLEEPIPVGAPPASQDFRGDRRKDRKRGPKKRRTDREESFEEEKPSGKADRPQSAPEKKEVPAVTSQASSDSAVAQTNYVATIIPPPTTLIREDLERLRKNDSYKGAFYNKEGTVAEEEDDTPVIPLSLQGDEEPIIKGPEDFPQPVEENTYKATPAPIEDEGRSSSPW
jgi:hypothetical protein